MSSAHILAAESEEALRELPMPAIAFFIIVFVLFLMALGVTWSFRNTAYKVQAPHQASQHGAHRAHAAPAQSAHAGQGVQGGQAHGSPLERDGSQH